MKDRNAQDHNMFHHALTIETKLPVKKVFAFAATNVIVGFTFGFLVRSLFDLKKY